MQATALHEWKALAAKGTAPDAALRKDYVAEIKATDGAARTIDFTISTGTVDRDKDTISPDGWKLAAFKKNPTVLWAHDYSMPPVARATKIRIEDGKLKARAEFAPAEAYPFAETVYQLLKGGFLSATSVGFRPIKHVFNNDRGGVDFSEQELLEFSIVPVPANSECLMEGKAAGIDTAPLLAWAQGVVKGLTPVTKDDPPPVKEPMSDCPEGDDCPMKGKAGAEDCPKDDCPMKAKAARGERVPHKDYGGYQTFGHTSPAKGTTAPEHVHDYSLWTYTDSLGATHFDGGKAFDIADHSHRITAASLIRGETEEADGHKHQLMMTAKSVTPTPDPDALLRAAVAEITASTKADLKSYFDALATKHEEAKNDDAFITLADEAVFEIELTEPAAPADVIEVSPEDLRAVLAGVVVDVLAARAATLKELVTTEVRGALNTLRGRVD